MSAWLPILGLPLRLALAWWSAATLLFWILGGIEMGFLLGLLLSPLVAGAMALYGTWVQCHHQSGPLAQRVRAFHHLFIHVPMAPSEADKALAALLQEDLAATTFSLARHRLHAVFQPPGWSSWWTRWALSDELIIEVLPAAPEAGEAGGSTLEVWAQPLSRLIYGFLWIDRGRNALRLRRFQEALGARLAQENLRKEALRKSDSVEARLAQAELLLLRAQVEPHFLFNTLAHLRELIHGGGRGSALEMLDHLIAYSRSVSDRIRQSTHRLDQELEAAKGYLSLIQLRFGDRLAFDIQVASEALDCEVPVGSLLIPLENAIKHGIEPRGTPGLVAVRGHLEDGSLCLEVRDNGPGLQMDHDSGRGTGLANLRERLQLLFSDGARLVVEDHEAGGVLVRVLMPAWRRTPSISAT